MPTRPLLAGNTTAATDPANDSDELGTDGSDAASDTASDSAPPDGADPTSNGRTDGDEPASSKRSATALTATAPPTDHPTPYTGPLYTSPSPRDS